MHFHYSSSSFTCVIIANPVLSLSTTPQSWSLDVMEVYKSQVVPVCYGHFNSFGVTGGVNWHGVLYIMHALAELRHQWKCVC